MIQAQGIGAWFRDHPSIAFYVVAISVLFGSFLIVGNVLYTPVVLAACLWALRSPLASVQALTIAFLFSAVNEGVYCFDLRSVEHGGGDSIVRYLLIAVCFARVVATGVMSNRMELLPVHKFIAFFAVTVLVCTLLGSYAIDVSLFKLVLFIIGLLTALGTVGAAFRTDARGMLSWLAAFMVALPWLSLPLAVLPLGYACNLNGFQGWLSQPQAFSVIMTMIGTWLLATALMGHAHRLVYVPTALVAFALIILSDSRSGIFAMLIAVTVTLVLNARRFSRRMGGIAIAGAVIVPLIAISPAGREAFDSVVRKRDQVSEFQTLSDQLFETRASLAQRSLDNFQLNPLVGMGFGTASDEHLLIVSRDPVFGLPLSAPTEKGVFWVAMLEEVGVFGAVAFMMILISFGARAITSPDPANAALFLASVLVNSGESMMFSFGGYGAFIWLMIAVTFWSARWR